MNDENLPIVIEPPPVQPTIEELLVRLSRCEARVTRLSNRTRRLEKFLVQVREILGDES